MFAQMRARVRAIRPWVVLVGLLASALVANLLQLNLRPDGRRFRPLPHFKTADITRIAERESQSLKARYEIFFQLGRKYPGSTIIVERADERAHVLVRSFLTFGRARNVVLADYNPEVGFSRIDYNRYVVGKGRFAAKGRRDEGVVPFVIAARGSPDVFLAMRRVDRMVLIDLGLVLEALDGPHD